VADGTIAGFGLMSYRLALEAIAELAGLGEPSPAEEVGEVGAAGQVGEVGAAGQVGEVGAAGKPGGTGFR
jgi:hypothetical protein